MHNTELSANTGTVNIQGSTTANWEAQNTLLESGTYEGWTSNNPPVGTEWDVQLYNQQEIEIQGLVAEGMHWDSNTVRIEQAEPLRANLGTWKDPSPALYGFIREYHIFTTKKLTSAEINQLFPIVTPLLPGMVGSALNENQLIFAVAREYTSYQNMVNDYAFKNDWRVTPTYENILGNGYPVAQGRIFYTRAVRCWLDATSAAVANYALQGLDVPPTRVSLMGKVVKPKNFNDHMAVLANNEGIGSW